jgi:GNAT superfamily N-acetyltransferase
MRIRDGERADIPALAELVLATDLTQRAWAGDDVGLPTLEEEALSWDLRFARRRATTRVAEDEDGRIVGVVSFAGATVTRESRELVPGLAHISAVFVAPDCWRRGIARQLLADADRYMIAAGFDRAQLWTLEGSPAEQLYAALGWVRDGRRDVYPPMGLHVVAYVRGLAS